MKTFIMLLLVAVTISACGDDDGSPTNEPVASTKTQADGLNDQRVGECHACNENATCYCWWAMIDGEPECVEEDRGIRVGECTFIKSEQ